MIYIVNMKWNSYKLTHFNSSLSWGGGGQSVKKGTNIENLQKIYLRLLKLAKRSPRLDKRIGSIKIDQKIDWTDGTWLIWWLPLAAYCLHHILGKESIRNVGKIDWSDGTRLIWRLPMAAYGSIGSACFPRNAAFSFKHDANRARIRNCKETEYSKGHFHKKLSTHSRAKFLIKNCVIDSSKPNSAWHLIQYPWCPLGWRLFTHGVKGQQHRIESSNQPLPQ